ncbi:CoA transferase [Streptomyces profundus]|uniref:CoA transferase n=1 Tax=Streptomyces profundus TaxID=2867410 RepID=UPI001D1662E9|nr:CoA transferase [Streptomyces sp. MA3_2.13]UED84130.1 CoA transferase [Streptomyces sp. MA3_2.13]
MTNTVDRATADVWAALGGPAELVRGVSFEGADGVLPARLPVRELARATVGACSLAAAELLWHRRGGEVPAVRVREAAVATAFVSERWLRVDGRVPTSFAPLSGFWRAADGWVRTHANYPHHRARLLSALGIPDSGDERGLVERLRSELAGRPAAAVREAVHAEGGLAVVVAPEARPADLPLVESWRVGSGAAPVPRDGGLPASGVRVLDLTRVIAGPVATRSLALLGADVLRVDSPRLREDEDAHADTGMGKRSTLLDLAAPGDLRRFDELLASADVVVTGYRPGALDRHGLAPEALLARRPGLVVAQLNAWGWSGPWAGRRGFDSLVQAASGIAAVEAADDGTPGVLPAQALDHGTGYLLAAAVLRALTERGTDGAGRQLRLSLAGTASWLLGGIAPQPLDGAPYAAEPWLTRTASPHGLLDHARTPLDYAGAPRDWASPSGRLGTDEPSWR